MKKVLILLLVLLLTSCGGYAQLFSGNYGGVVEIANLSQDTYVPQNVVFEGDFEYNKGFVIPKNGLYELAYSVNLVPQSDIAYLSVFVIINGSISPIASLSGIADAGEIISLSSSGIFELKKNDIIHIGFKSEVYTEVLIKNITVFLRR